MTPKAIRALENRDFTTFAQELKQSLSESKMNVLKETVENDEWLNELTNNKLLAYQKKASKDILDRKMEKDKKREDKHLDGIDLANKKIARNNSNFTKASMKKKLQESRPRLPYVSPGWADTRQTDMIVATAIHAVAKGRRTPEEIWDAPTKQEMQAVKNTIVDYIKYGYYDFDPFGFQWGQETIRVKDPEGLFEGFKRGDKVKIVSKGDEYNNKTGEVYRIDAKKEAMTVEFENGRVVSYGFDEVIKEN